LMHAFEIAFEKGRLIADDLPEAGATDDLESLARAGGGGQVNGHGLYRPVQPIVDELVTAFGFTLDRKMGGNCPGELARNIEQLCNRPALELELHLAQRRRTVASIDRPPVYRQ